MPDLNSCTVKNDINLLKIGTFSFNVRWFNVVTALAMIALICHLYGYTKTSQHLFITGLAIFLSATVFMVMRIIVFSRNTLNELLNPENTLYLHTIVGTVNLVGVCLSRIFHWYTTANILWYIGIALWVGISLATFTILFLCQKPEDRKIEEVLHGGWFFATLSTQSTVFLGTIIMEQTTGHTLIIQLLSFALWSIGAWLYLILSSIIFLRLFFCKFSDITTISPYWMNIGAAGATALAGVSLYQHIQIAGGPFLDLLPFLKGMSLFFWSIGLWWLPFLLILAVVKQKFRTGELVFTVGYWEIVLTLGLYATGTGQLSHVFEGQYLPLISQCFSLSSIMLGCFLSLFTVVHLVRSSIWVPINELTINDVVPYSFKLSGRVFFVKEVVSEWLDQNVMGVSQKCYKIVTRENLTGLVSYNTKSKKWYFDAD